MINAPFLRRVSLHFVLLVAVVFSVWVGLAPVSAVQFDTQRLLQQAQSRYGQAAANRMTNWFGLLERVQAMGVQQQLREVNRFWNSNVQGVDDIVLWRQADYWATPLETLGKGAGDCEDYVIGKYFSLLKLGVSPEKLRLIYVRARMGGQTIAHMVLGYYETPASEPLILDSLTSTMVVAGRRPDLTPVFSFNAQGIYVAGQERSVESISRWQGLLIRMRNEGIHP